MLTSLFAPTRGGQRSVTRDPTSDIEQTLWKLGARPRPIYIGAVDGPRGWRLYYYVEPALVPKFIKGDAAIKTGLALAQTVGQGGIPLKVGADRYFLTVDLPRPRAIRVPVAPLVCHQQNLNQPERLCVEIGVEAYGRLMDAPSGQGYQAVRPPRVRLDLGSERTPHFFGAGTTGAGKTAIERVIMALVALHNPPDLVRMVAIDSKNRAFAGPLSRLDHLVWRPATTKADGNQALRAVAAELERREHEHVNRPYWLVFIDELADLEHGDLWSVVRKGRECGIIVVAFSQRLAGDIAKRVADQFPGRLCGRVAPKDYQTSQAVLGTSDALTSQGDGDWFVVQGDSTRRFQAAFAPLADAHGAPDDPFWSDPRWLTVATAGPARPVPGQASRVAYAPAGPSRRVPQTQTPHPTQQPKLPTDEEIAWAAANHWTDTDGTIRSAGVEAIIAHLRAKGEPCGVTRAQRIRDAAQAALDTTHMPFQPSGPPRDTESSGLPGRFAAFVEG